jgi:hypothetical protein
MGENLFDKVRDISFDKTSKVFGYSASWTPSAGGDPQIVQVLFNEPDHMQKLGDIEYLPTQDTMEYRAPFFPTLKASVDVNNDETVVIKGSNYYVRSVKKIYDGATFIAIVEKIPS